MAFQVRGKCRVTVDDSDDNSKVNAGGVTTTIRNLEYVSYDTNGNIVLNQDSDTETPEAGIGVGQPLYTPLNAIQIDKKTARRKMSPELSKTREVYKVTQIVLYY